MSRLSTEYLNYLNERAKGSYRAIEQQTKLDEFLKKNGDYYNTKRTRHIVDLDNEKKRIQTHLGKVIKQEEKKLDTSVNDAITQLEDCLIKEDRLNEFNEMIGEEPTFEDYMYGVSQMIDVPRYVKIGVVLKEFFVDYAIQDN